MHNSVGDAAISFFSKSSGSSISDSGTAWNHTKYNFCVHILLGKLLSQFFQNFWGKCRSCVLLNEIAQKFIYKMYIIINNNYTC